MNSRNFAYDFIRALAIFLVVCIHSQGMLLDAAGLEENAFGPLHWCRACWHIIYVGVPLFVMLSGALLLGKQEPMKEFFRKRFTRILIPFIIWSTLIGFLLYYKEHHTLTGCIEWIVTSTFTKGVIGIYWYVYLIAGLYLITPLLRHIIANGGIIAAKYMVGLAFGLVIFNELTPNIALVNRFACDNLLWIGYYVLGYVIVHTPVNLRKGHLGMILLLVLALLYIGGVAEILVTEKGSALKPIITILEAITVFLLLSKTDYQKMAAIRFVAKGITLLSEISYGMYLTHFVFISLLLSVQFVKNTSLIVEPLVMAITACVLDAVMLVVLKKLRLQKWAM